MILMQFDPPKKGIWHDQPATRWEEGFVLGNGEMGAIVFGDPRHDRLIGNHADLFLPTSHQQPTPDLSDLLPKVRQLIETDGYQAAVDFQFKMATERGYQGLQMSDPFVPAFELAIDFHINNVAHYKRALNYQTGEALSCYLGDGEQIQTQTFVSRHDNLIIHRIRNFDGALNLTLSPQIYHNEALSGHFYYQDCQFKWHNKYRHKEGGYTVTAQLFTHHGKVTEEDDLLHVTGTKELIVVFRIDLSLMAPPIKQLTHDYQTLFSQHVVRHQSLFDRVQLHLKHDKDPSENFYTLMSDATNRETLPLTLVEKIYDAGRYMYIASAGHKTPNLQGIWSGDFQPAWSGDYTFDTNVQLSIAQALSGNLEEGLFGFFDLVESLLPDFKENAKRFFNSSGIVSSIHSSTHGHHIHWNKDWPLHYWTCGAGWLGHWFYQYYHYTGDIDFLRERTVPYLEEIIAFYQDFLTIDESGHYLFRPSYSAENGCGDNATQDIAVLKEVITNLITSYQVLGIKPDQIAILEKMKDQLPPYMINEEGAFKEWLTPNKGEAYNHRHFSHLYPIFQSREFTQETDPIWFNACQVAFDKRRRAWLESEEGDTTSTHGRMHSALLATQFHMPELVKEVMMMVLKNNCFFPSLMMSHYNQLEVFNVDGNGAFPQVIHEMLIDYHHDTLYLLQALPEEISAGELSGVKLPNQINVLQLNWDLEKKSLRVMLMSPVEQRLALRFPLFKQAKLHGELATEQCVDLVREQTVVLEFEL